jgi:lipopolysaccharide transport system permease protein
MRQVADQTLNQDRRTRPVLDITPAKGWASFRLSELWTYRELLLFIAWRDVRVRYKQTVFGVLWAVLQPLLLMVVFSVLFSRAIEVPTGGIPYPVFAYCALLPWTLFAQAVNAASSSLVGNSSLVSKVFFPRLVLPVAVAAAFLVDFVIAFFILLGLMVYYDLPFLGTMLLVIPLTLLTLLTALSIGVWLSAINVRYRDVQYAIPFLVQVLLFLSPVAYGAYVVPDSWQLVYSLNPMVGILGAYRWAILGVSPSPGVALAIGMGVTFGMSAIGIAYFRRAERIFADVI